MNQQHPQVETLPLQDADTSERVVVDRSPEGLHLRGSKCVSCSATYFPPADICFECQATRLEPVSLTARGRLYSYSTVHVSSSRPVPYTIGYVDLESGVRILAQLPEDHSLEPDVAVELSPTSTNENWFFIRSDAGQVAEGARA